MFLTRRLSYVVLTLVCFDEPNVLIHAFLFSNLVYVGYMGAFRPQDSTMGRRMEYLNECGLQLITYHLALFPLSPSLDDENLAGFSMIGTVCAVFVGNLGVMIVMTLLGVKRKLYLRKLRRKHN